MHKKGSSVIEILREQEKNARLKFWNMLLSVNGQSDVVCPFIEEPPVGAVLFGTMPKKLRYAFIRAYQLRSEERKAEAEVFEEALNDLLQ